MIKKYLWLLISCLMVLSLVIASCGPAVVEEEKEEEEVKMEEEEEEEEEMEEVVKAKEMATDSLGRKVEKPQYGGTYTFYLTSSPLDWDEAYQPAWM
ncbi:hypothetical protein ACFLUG_04830, partial [Chloroflexota bacterium]